MFGRSLKYGYVKNGYQSKFDGDADNCPVPSMVVIQSLN